MMQPRRKPYQPSADRLQTRKIRINLIEARGLNPPVVSMLGPWNAAHWCERNLYIFEAIEVRDRLLSLFPPDRYPLPDDLADLMPSNQGKG